MVSSWEEFIQQEQGQPYYQQIIKRVKEDMASSKIFPPRRQLFRAFEETPLHQVKVLVLGQDPYHGQNQANGLAFSVSQGDAIPPSLRNIYRELHTDLGIPSPFHGDLSSWANQGVLLLNSSLTVLEGQPGSHSEIGWHTFTDRAISLLDQQPRPIAFVFWGAHARRKKALIAHSQHLIIESAHPSPLSARNGFFDSKPFSRINQFLQQHQQTPINWQIP